MGGRFDVFHALEHEKQQRIIDAALTEFAEKGFKRASTNAIAENAHIGKGMLFYYFGSKEELFDFLCEYSLAFARDKYFGCFEIDTGDFVERCRILLNLKQTAMKAQPKIIAFYERIYRESGSESLSKYIEDAYELREQTIRKMYENIDYSLFRDDIGGKEIVSYIKWLFDAYQNDAAERFKRSEFTTADDATVAKEWAMYEEFISNLKKLFYK